MADKVIDVPGFGPTAFPDSMSDSDIVAAIQRQHPDLAPKPTVSPDDRTASQVRRDQVNSVLGGVGDFFTGLPNAAYQALKTQSNPLSQDSLQSMLAMYHGIKDPLANLAGDAKALVTGSGPVSTPEQQSQYGNLAGQNAAGLLTGIGAERAPDLVEALNGQRPSVRMANAGAKLNAAMDAAKSTPINTDEAAQIAMRAKQLSDSGTTLPKVFSDFINKYPADAVAPMTYDIGRDFASNSGDLGFGEKQLVNKKMGRLVKQFGRAMDTANQGAADTAGVGDLNAEGISEYAAAARRKALLDTLRKYGTRAAATAAIGSGLYGVAKELTK